MQSYAELKFTLSNFSMHEISPHAHSSNFCAIIAQSIAKARRSPALLLDVHALLTMLLEALTCMQMLAFLPVCLALVYEPLMLLGASLLKHQSLHSG